VKKAKGKSKRAKGRGSQLFIKSGLRLPFAFDLFTFAFYFLASQPAPVLAHLMDLAPAMYLKNPRQRCIFS
jgi:hypothetical protein